MMSLRDARIAEFRLLLGWVWLLEPLAESEGRIAPASGNECGDSLFTGGERL